MLQQVLADPSVQVILLGLLGALSLALVALIMSLLFRLAAAAGVRLSKEQWELVRTFVQAGIRAAEEWAARQIKQGGQAPTPSEKTAHAVAFAKSMAPPKMGLSEERLAAVVEAELPAERQRLSLPVTVPPPANPSATTVPPSRAF
jgi:hypothetical protein